MAPRTGLVTDERGTNTPLPAWPYPKEANGAVGTFANLVRGLLDHGSHYERQNLLIYNANTARLAKGQDALLNPPPLLPNNDARRAEARRREKMVADSKAKIVGEVAKLLGERDSLRAFDPPSSERQPLLAEMRSLSRAMSPEQRNDLIKSDPDFREAVLSAKPWMSGIPASEHGVLYQAAMQARYGQRLQELEAGIDAGSRALEVHHVVARAIANELTVVGAPTVEPNAPPAPPSIELLVVK